MGSAAIAATVSFNVDNNWSQGDLTFTGSDGTTVTAGASLYNNSLPNPVFYGDPYIASWAGSTGGIGICSGDNHVNTNTNSTKSCHDNHQVDGKGSNEAVIVSFGTHEVDILSVTFAYVGDNDDYEIFMQNSDGFNINLSLPDDCWVCTVSNFNVGSDIAFAFGAWHKSDDWKLQAIEYEKVDDDGETPPPVPLPAGGGLLIAGLGVLAAMRRRRT